MKRGVKFFLAFSLLFTLVFLIFSYHLQKNLIEIYQRGESLRILDREGREIAILPNERGNFARYINKVPPNVKELLLKKEDKYFYYHFGFNPWAIFQEILNRLGLSSRKASSTISQQLVKILLGHEKERTLKNKVVEFFYTLALEIYHPKEEILKMYLNSIYLGNQAQGLEEASRLYFGVSSEMLTKGQILQILATISKPHSQNPAEIKNKKVALKLAKRLKLGDEIEIADYQEIRQKMKQYSRLDTSYFEISSFLKKSFLPKESKEIYLTIDKEITRKIREIVKRNIDDLKKNNARHGAVIVIKLPENEILAMIGSPDPTLFEDGYQINMIQKPRAVGSTIKPFIYLKAFEKGLRPYTLVEDREYKYLTALGFPLYPRNFDRKYRGEVTLHYALSNSLNVPTVKVLEYLGLEDFYRFLERDLEFFPPQKLENYQLGIALGALEMSLWDLARFFTIFPNEGILKNVKLLKEEKSLEKRISPKEYVQLVNKILSDRKTGIEQFGLRSDLNLFQENYALKTGTSRNFKDSWVIGFTPDFLVGVWVGNVDNTPTQEISGQLGAGKIWADVMELLFNSKYNKKTPFSFDLVKEFSRNGKIEYGLENDDFEKTQNLLKEKDLALILSPHNGDIYLLEEKTRIILRAREEAIWFINDNFFRQGKEVIFIPPKPGSYSITAKSTQGRKDTVIIFVM